MECLEFEKKDLNEKLNFYGSQKTKGGQDGNEPSINEKLRESRCEQARDELRERT